MKNSFDDLRSLSDKKPIWFDENGTPRFIQFHPTHCPNIYNNQSFLVLIACQGCKEEFNVELSFAMFNSFSGEISRLHYGDPPAHGCAGDTMTSEALKVIQAWNRAGRVRDWKRVKKLEVKIPSEPPPKSSVRAITRKRRAL